MISSEAKKKGVTPSKPIKEMTAEELKIFRNSFDPDSMGYDGKEGADNGD
jgi:hypothetical protein